MKKEQIEIISRLKRLCEICNSNKYNYLYFDYLFEIFGFEKNDFSWSLKQINDFMDRLRMVLELFTLDYWSQIDIKRYRYFFTFRKDIWKLCEQPTQGPAHKVKILFIHNNFIIESIRAPFITWQILKLLCTIEDHSLRICDSKRCDNLFYSSHKTKKFCSKKCRDYMNNTNARKRLTP